MDTEQRLRQLTADLPGTATPDPETLASIVARGRRAVLVQRVALVASAVAVVVGASLVLPRALDRHEPPIIGPVEHEPVPDAVDPVPNEDADERELSIGTLPSPSEAPSPEAPPRPEPTPAPATQPSSVPTVEATTEPSPTTSPKPSPTPTPSPSTSPSPAPVAAYDGFDLTVTTDARSYAAGTPTSITITACNRTDLVRTQTHPGSDHDYDLWIKDAATGKVVADTSSRTYSTVAETVRWEPGQCREFAEVWDGTTGALDDGAGEPVPAGTYQVKVQWQGREGDALLAPRVSPNFERAGTATAPKPFEGFTVTVTPERSSYVAGEAIKLKVRACNTSDVAREQVLPQEGHHYDLYVKNADGHVVADTTWRSYSGGSTTITFAPGACQSWAETWMQDVGPLDGQATGDPVPPGTYTAKLEWLGTESGQSYGWVMSDPFTITAS